MGDVAHAALHDRADLALALAGLGGDAAHVGDIGHALDHQHVALLRQIVGLELRHPVDVIARALERVDALQDVAHGQRRPDDGLAGDGRLEHRGADDSGRDAELVHGVRDDPGRIAERHEALDHAHGRARHRHQLDVLGRDAAGQSFLCRYVLCKPPTCVFREASPDPGGNRLAAKTRRRNDIHIHRRSQPKSARKARACPGGAHGRLPQRAPLDTVAAFPHNKGQPP